MCVCVCFRYSGVCVCINVCVRVFIFGCAFVSLECEHARLASVCGSIRESSCVCVCVCACERERVLFVCAVSRAFDGVAGACLM